MAFQDSCMNVHFSASLGEGVLVSVPLPAKRYCVRSPKSLASAILPCHGSPLGDKGKNNTLWFFDFSTYRSQSTATISVTSLAGSPTAVKTITMVTRPALGIPAAPMLASVAVMLKHTQHRN